MADERAKRLAEASQAAEQRRREAEERVQPADARIAAGTAGYDGMEQDEEDGGAKMVSTDVPELWDGDDKKAADAGMVSSDVPWLYEMFRQHRLEHPLGENDAGLRAQRLNCEHQKAKQGPVESHLYYAFNSRAGLSDRAWVISHLLALANALCARPGIPAPYQMLGQEHNIVVGPQPGSPPVRKPMKPSWWWDRYFSLPTLNPLERFERYSGPGDGVSPTAEGSVNQHLPCPGNEVNRSQIGPSDTELQVKRDLSEASTAKASGKPFVWCLNYNMRRYLGADGFNNRSDVPHNWFKMRRNEPWLGGSEDETARSNGEFALGPSKLVREVALRVRSALGLAAATQTGTLDRAQRLASPEWVQERFLARAQTAALQRSIDPRDKGDRHWPQEPSVEPGASCWGPHCNRWIAGRCTAHYGDRSPCCGQAELDIRDPPDVRTCPQGTPFCVGYLHNITLGSCVADSPADTALAKKAPGAESECSGPSCGRWGAGRCTAHFGGARPCCGQDALDLRNPQDVRPCPEGSPDCVGYVFGKRMGACFPKNATHDERVARHPQAERIAQRKEERQETAKQLEAERERQREDDARQKEDAQRRAEDEKARIKTGNMTKRELDGLKCTAHFGASTPCCGQDELDQNDPQDIRACPQYQPKCENCKRGARTHAIAHARTPV